MLAAHFRSRGRNGAVCERKVPKGTGKGLFGFPKRATIVDEIYLSLLQTVAGYS